MLSAPRVAAFLLAAAVTSSAFSVGSLAAPKTVINDTTYIGTYQANNAVEFYGGTYSRLSPSPPNADTPIGISYGHAARFEAASLHTNNKAKRAKVDATAYGKACPQPLVSPRPQRADTV